MAKLILGIVIIIFYLFFVDYSIASELIGTISTNPEATTSNGQANEQPEPGKADVKIVDSSGLLPLLLNQKQKKESEEVKVLGLTKYPDKTLLRGSKGRIYVVAGAIKKHLKNLKELKKYRGQTIYDVTDQELSVYPDRPYIDSELIREKSTHSIYVIVKNKKQLIMNLEELRTHYAGLEIFNISQEEMSLY